MADIQHDATLDGAVAADVAIAAPRPSARWSGRGVHDEHRARRRDYGSSRAVVDVGFVRRLQQ